jgi:hypothetical protein
LKPKLKRKIFPERGSIEGLVVFAGTINPYVPKQLIPSSNMPQWLEGLRE